MTETASAWVRCIKCGDLTDHSVLHDYMKVHTAPWEYETIHAHHQLVQCRGCKTVRYRKYLLDIHETGTESGFPEPYKEEVYPSPSNLNQIRHPKDFSDDEDSKAIPSNVLKMYSETIKALNASAMTLAGGGLRATVEAICLSQKITGNTTLAAKIDELHKLGLLTKSQADFLHEGRYLGNSSLHEMATPHLDDLENVLQIVETMISTIFLLPVKAERMKKKRTKPVAKRKTKRPKKANL